MRRRDVLGLVPALLVGCARDPEIRAMETRTDSGSRASASPRKLRILCLHGYHGSGRILRGQTAAFAGELSSLAELVFIDAPSLAAGDFGWWHAVSAEQDAADDLNCRTYSAAPGTELYAQCRAGLAHARAIRQSAPAKSAKTRPLDCTSLALGGGLNCH